MLKVKNSAPSTRAQRIAKHKSNRLTARKKEPGFGDVIRTRRRELDLTQEEVASRIKTSTPYVGHLESGKRHPSNSIVTKLADVLGFDNRELFFLANPHTEALLSPQPEKTEGSVSAWDQFRENEQLRRIHNVSNVEMEMLSQVALLGEVRSPRDLVFILNTVRHAIGR
jgi:transcriptional regulator with XRE-family HTH domain